MSPPQIFGSTLAESAAGPLEAAEILHLVDSPELCRDPLGSVADPRRIRVHPFNELDLQLYAFLYYTLHFCKKMFPLYFAYHLTEAILPENRDIIYNYVIAMLLYQHIIVNLDHKFLKTPYFSDSFMTGRNAVQG